MVMPKKKMEEMEMTLRFWMFTTAYILLAIGVVIFIVYQMAIFSNAISAVETIKVIR